MLRWKRTSMAICNNSHTPCKLLCFPDILHMTHSIICVVISAYNNTVNHIIIFKAHSILYAIKIELIVSVLCFCLELCSHLVSSYLRLSSIYSAKWQFIICAYCCSLVVRRDLTKYIVWVVSTLKKSLLSLICCCRNLALDICCDIYLTVICNLCIILIIIIEIICDLYRECYTVYMLSFWISMIWACCQSISGLLLCGRCGGIYCDWIVIKISLVKLIIWNVHEYILWFQVIYSVCEVW